MLASLKERRVFGKMKSDKRKYDWSAETESFREEYDVICNWVKKDSKVIDLACGNGSLMNLLTKRNDSKCVGVEKSKSGVEICKNKGLTVRNGSIDEKLDYLKDNEFDYSICSVTIQMLFYPEVTLSEMKRISKYQIISFPNYGYFTNRIELMFLGRFPRRQLAGYDWFDTGHIHNLTIKDFKNTVTKIFDLEILDFYFPGKLRSINRFNPNLLASTGVFLTKRI